MQDAGHGALRVVSATSVEEIASRYLELAEGNPLVALRAVIEDALVDMLELERRSRRAERAVSRGYVRAHPGL